MFIPGSAKRKEEGLVQHDRLGWENICVHEGGGGGSFLVVFGSGVCSIFPTGVF